MRRSTMKLCGVAGAGALAAVMIPAAIPAVTGSVASATNSPASRHVLVLSVDGLHQSDLAYFVKHNPGSALAALVNGGTDYTHASTTFPSDSFPGMVAQFTGGSPKTAGIFYDDTWNRRLLPAGTLNCRSTAPGAEVSFTEAADKSQNPLTLDAGQGLSSPTLNALPTNTLAQTLAAKDPQPGTPGALSKAILNMTPTPQALLNPAALPVNPANCQPVYPHQYLRVNTVFEVARSHGLLTAWSDKHPAYEILDGPSGAGIKDLFTPEINSVADTAGDDWSTDNALTQEYDSTKADAVINEIDGFDHSGTHHAGTPAVFGMNFQSVSTAEKLPTSDGMTGGYNANGTPGPLLMSALNFVNGEVGAMRKAIHAHGLEATTTIILSAKHGQSPEQLSQLRRVDDGAIISAIDDAWTALHPQAAPLVAFGVDDDGMLLWLSNRSAGAEAFVKQYLLTHTAPANKAGDAKGVYTTSVTHSGLTSVFTGNAADARIGAATGDPHVPDVIGIAQQGVVYTGGVKKIAEHGGDHFDDLNVPLVVSGAGAGHRTVTGPVATTQIAPTILKLLGLNPSALQAVALEGTAVLPKL